MNTHVTSETQSLSHRITQWVKVNDWYHIDIQTNQLRLEQTFGQIIEAVAKDLDYHNQHRMTRRIFDLYDLMLAKCLKIDTVCRTGCRSEEELLDLEFLKSKVVGVAAEFADVLSMIRGKENNDCQSPQPQPCARSQRTRKSSSQLSKKEQQVWAAIQVQGKTVTQTAIEFSCTPQNISKHLNNAQRKLKAQQSRSANTTRRLPEDRRSQIAC